MSWFDRAEIAPATPTYLPEAPEPSLDAPTYVYYTEHAVPVTPRAPLVGEDWDRGVEEDEAPERPNARRSIDARATPESARTAVVHDVQGYRDSQAGQRLY